MCSSNARHLYICKRYTRSSSKDNEIFLILLFILLGSRVYWYCDSPCFRRNSMFVENSKQKNFFKWIYLNNWVDSDVDEKIQDLTSLKNLSKYRVSPIMLHSLFKTVLKKKFAINRRKIRFCKTVLYRNA